LLFDGFFIEAIFVCGFIKSDYIFAVNAGLDILDIIKDISAAGVKDFYIPCLPRQAPQ
jgi:hypothetical protein